MYNEDNCEINIFFKKTLVRILSHFHYFTQAQIRPRQCIYARCNCTQEKTYRVCIRLNLEANKGPEQWSLMQNLCCVPGLSIYSISVAIWGGAQFSYIRKTAIEKFIERLLRSVYALSAYIDVHPIVVKRSIVDAAKNGFNIWMCHSTEQQLSGGRVVGVLCFSCLDSSVSSLPSFHIRTRVFA